MYVQCENMEESLEDVHEISGPRSDQLLLCICSGRPTTTPHQTTTVTILEGGSANISCASTGNPIPTISWELRGSTAPFQQSNRVSDYQATAIGNQQLSFTQGNVSSVLQITSAAYPAHSGQYTCVGFSSHGGRSRTSHATITVDVQGMVCNLTV